MGQLLFVIYHECSAPSALQWSFLYLVHSGLHRVMHHTITTGREGI